jgi:prepilin-type processing-associated H-X9-DG protein
MGGSSNAGGNFTAAYGAPNIDRLNAGTNAVNNAGYIAGLGRCQTNQVVQRPDGVPAVNTVINVFQCPADVLPPNKGNGYGKTNYVGNMGNTAKWGTTGTPPVPLTSFGCGGVRGNRNNGILLYANENNNTYVVKIGDIKDGTSNTLMIGEATTSLNVNVDNDNTSRFPVWAGGNGGGCNGTTSIGTTLRVADPLAGYPICSGTDCDASNNAAFGSQHTGGVMFAMGDGSVKFVSTSINPLALAAAASRRGGESISLNQ